jgi:divalent metal cation (Fe/Co/Zn/Cd) transporter
MASMNRIQTFAAVSIAVGIAVLGLKYSAYVLTGSVALLSEREVPHRWRRRRPQ